MLDPQIVLGFAIGGVVAAVVVPVTIGWQRRRNLGQQIYEDGPSSHAVKQGTPTLGGIAFVAAAAIGALVPIAQFEHQLPLLLLVVGAGAIGFADDYLKLVLHRPLGLRARWKFLALFVLAAGFAAYEAHADPYHFTSLWFTGWVPLAPWLWALLAVCAIVGAANAVNLTDGLDGLAAGTAIPPLLLLGFMAPSTLAVAVVGSATGFLYFNTHPARIFMGDTGSLALGALLGGLAIQMDWLLLLPVLGIVFVAEALSVIAQVLSFKLTGKRIFRMTPLHHHFEMLGWPEQRVTLVFILASAAASLITFFALLLALTRGHH
jgi:phospho-N-acetylmuramoyl-pentapeptide-transferase